jgi:hypothetical protein
MRFLRDRVAPARLFFLALFGLGAAALQDLSVLGSGSGQAVGPYSLRWLALMVGVGIVSLGALGMVFVFTSPSRADAWTGRLESVRQRLSRLGILNWVLIFLLWAAFVVIVFDRFGYHFNHVYARAWFFLIVAGLGAVLSAAAVPGQSFLKSFLSVVVLYGAATKAISYLPSVTSFPFSLGWSEASRYYYASLPYSQRLFGLDIPLSPWHPSRYLMLGMAYWIPESSLWLNRLWQVVLWLVMSGLGGMALGRRLAGRDRASFWIFTGWSLLFLLEGPVYYHLMVSVLLVLWGFDLARPRKTLVFLILASLWAGISRINWVPVPAFLAIALYLLERPVCEERKWWRYVLPGVLWGVVGISAALVSQAAYIPLSGNEDVSKFGSSFTSDLLWYRLLPSPTYPMGVFPAVMTVTLPLLVLIGVNWVRGRKNWHVLRLAGLGLMLLVLLAGGLVVSTKIGGGSNIHNMDAFMVLVWIVGSSIGFGRFASETGRQPAVWRPWAAVGVIVAVAVLWSVNIANPFQKLDFAQAQFDLDKLNKVVEKYGGEDKEVLFITQRQLVIFYLTPGVKMTPEYELLTLMEMAISNNQPYLSHFTADLRNHRFALIVADRQHDMVRDPELHGFAEENNAWVNRVAAPLLEYYQSELFLETQGVDLMIPKE